MSRGTGPLRDGWEAAIPDAIWPDALVAAVRADLGVLGVPRVLDTLRRWRAQAEAAPDARARGEALRRLREVGAALAHVGGAQVQPQALGAATEPAPDERPNRPIEGVEVETGEVEVSALRGAGGAPADPLGPSVSARDFAAEEEPPTMLRSFTAPGAVGELPPRAADERPPETADEQPTAYLRLPGELQGLLERASTVAPAVRLPEEDPGEPPPRAPRLAAERRPGATPPAPPSATPPSMPPPLPPAPSSREEPAAAPLAPKPGVVRRSVAARRSSPVRPRAAMQQVRALHAVVRPLCEELMPLGPERRARRFWARWREVAGDRGVRREFVESLLLTAGDLRTLVCGLIAEVQTVDVESVYVLVDKLEADGGGERSPGARPGATPDRQRGPLIGAEVRVEGVSLDDGEG